MDPDNEKSPGNVSDQFETATDVVVSTSERRTDNGSLHRRLNNRQIQLIAAGGTIGTAIFINIGGAYVKSGPASLLLSYILYSMVMGLVNNSIAEMNTFMPVAGGFVRLAGYWVDDALGFLAGWNFFIYEALLIPFEITALTLTLSFWNENVTNPGPTAGICIATIFLYGLLNVIAIKFYGEAEFWLSGGKVLLIFLLFSFTFVTMVGGNPKGDAYGFRNFSYPPGGFAEYLSSGSLGRFEGFLAALFNAGFTIAGPEYISIISAEAKYPTTYIKNAFKTVYYRFGVFFIGSALAISIVCAYNDPQLRDIYFGSGRTSGTAGASPYVIAMTNLGIEGLPHLVNALILTSIFSAGNTYTYCATRALYSLSIEGRALAFLRYCSKNGIPVYCFAVVMIFPCLSLLQVQSGSAVVLSWFVSFITGGGLITFLIMSFTFLNYYKACQVQGVDRKTHPYYGYFQPYGAYIAIAVQSVLLLFYGYTSFRPWDTETFFKNYSMQILAILLFAAWKIGKKTKYIRPEEVDLVWERPQILAYEEECTDPKTHFWQEMGQLIGIGRR